MKFLVFLALVAVSTFLVSGQVTTEVPAASSPAAATSTAAPTTATAATTSTAAPTTATVAAKTTTAAKTPFLPHGFSYFTAKSYH
uniref:Uncharacterized protein n=1 Tax=Bos mutus grunniens TaxID=30521 RepID=A0A8C0A2D9_BOSMU